MSEKWDYSVLSQNAKMHGGPEKYLKIIEENGVSMGMKKMFPWIGVTAVVGIAAGGAIVKGVQYLKWREEKKNYKVEDARQKIVEAIKEYSEICDDTEISIT